MNTKLTSSRLLAPNQKRLLRESYAAWWSNSQEGRGSVWLQTAWTLLFILQATLVIVALLWIFREGKVDLYKEFIKTFQVATCIGLACHGLFQIGYYINKALGLKPHEYKPMYRLLYFAGLPLMGVVLGLSIFLLLKGYNPVLLVIQYPNAMLTMFAISMMVVLVLFVVWLQRDQKLRHLAQTQQMQRQAMQSELRALQSQIEPHFLFNTLANVVSLMDYDAPQAKRMLEAFIEYLRGTLDANRKLNATVNDELQLIERYLALLQIRLGERLRYAIVADTAVRQQPLAPLMLQPLVENAVKYGIEPRIEGGLISITARLFDHETLELNVMDDGMGLEASSTARKGSGTALGNIRERLQALYGDKASLTLSSNAPLQGAKACIRIPLIIYPTVNVN